MDTTATALAEPARFSRRVDLKFRLPGRFAISWVGLAAILTFAALFEAGTFRGFSVQLITALSGCLLIASLGQNLVVMLGAVDLSVPAIMTLAAAMNVHFATNTAGLSSLLITLAVCAAISAVSGALIAFLRLNALIVTFAMNAIIAAALTAWLGQSFSGSGKTAGWLHSLATAHVGAISELFLIALAISGGIATLLSFTRPGRRVAAVGANRTAARMLGAHVGLVTTATFALAGALYGLAGMFVAGFVNVPDSGLGNSYQLTTITVVAIAGTSFAGGTSSIASLVAAAALLTTLNQVLALENLSPGTLYVVQGVLLVVAVSLNAWTRFGRALLQRLHTVEQS